MTNEETAVINSVTRKTRCRYFVRIGGRIDFVRGFRSKADASQWVDDMIEKHGLSWRVGNLVCLRNGVEFDVLTRADALARRALAGRAA